MSPSARGYLARQWQKTLSEDRILQGISQELGLAPYFGTRILRYRQTLFQRCPGFLGLWRTDLSKCRVDFVREVDERHDLLIGNGLDVDAMLIRLD